MENKTIEIKALVTQTVERTYKMEVPVEESKEDIHDLFESGNVTDIFISNESGVRELSKKVISVVDVSALKREAEEATQRQNEMETKREAR